jgi:hypothetical protein
MGKAAFVLMIATLCFAYGFAFAGEQYRWYIIKGKDGVCRVIEADKRTPASIAGPFKTRENAEAAKEDRCNRKTKKSKKSTSTKKKKIDTSELEKLIIKAIEDLFKQKK